MVWCLGLVFFVFDRLCWGCGVVGVLRCCGLVVGLGAGVWVVLVCFGYAGVFVCFWALPVGCFLFVVGLVSLFVDWCSWVGVFVGLLFLGGVVLGVGCFFVGWGLVFLA